ncbi:MAG: glycosyltransferase family 4 protein [Oscillospiraceae bacterium]|nr:glycosyltransferase family 4 protein [Oscillospiraceae bacterium]
MKIAFDGRGINWYSGTGIGTYSLNILKNLLEIDKENSYHIFWCGGNFEKLNYHNTSFIFSSKKQYKFFENFYFPQYINTNFLDVYHLPQNGLGLNENILAYKVITLHDIIPYTMPDTVGKGYLSKFIENIPKIIKLADAIITVSEYSKEDICRFFPYSHDKIHVIPLAANSNFKKHRKDYCKAYLSEMFKINKEFILYVGGFSPRKNVPILIEAFSKIKNELKTPHNLVIVGSHKDQILQLEQLVSALGIEDDVIFTGYVSDDELPLFYSACDLFVYPSLYEGFGLPILEAMNCGAPVITVNCTSIPEVSGDAAIYFDGCDVLKLSNEIVDLVNDNTKKILYSERSTERAKLFKWEKTAEKTMEVYKLSNNE